MKTAYEVTIGIVSQPRNMGQGRGRNRIIDEARGRYLYFLDGDDSIEPNTIEVLHAALKRHGAEIAYASHRRIEQFGTRQEISRLMASPLTLGEICRFRSRRIPNLLLYLLGVLPPVLSVAIIALAGRRKGLI